MKGAADVPHESYCIRVSRALSPFSFDCWAETFSHCLTSGMSV